MTVLYSSQGDISLASGQALTFQRTFSDATTGAPVDLTGRSFTLTVFARDGSIAPVAVDAIISGPVASMTLTSAMTTTLHAANDAGKALGWQIVEHLAGGLTGFVFGPRGFAVTASGGVSAGVQSQTVAGAPVVQISSPDGGGTIRIDSFGAPGDSAGAQVKRARPTEIVDASDWAFATWAQKPALDAAGVATAAAGTATAKAALADTAATNATAKAAAAQSVVDQQGVTLGQVAQAKTDAQAARDAASGSATATAADRVQTGQDRTATGQAKVDAQAARDAAAASATATTGDRTQTGLDRTATGADRVQTGLDRVATGTAVTATAADRVQTGQDRTATGADRTQTALDRAATGTAVTSTAADRTAVALMRSVTTASGNVALVAGRTFALDANAADVTATLPANPNDGDTVLVEDQNASWLAHNVYLVSPDHTITNPANLAAGATAIGEQLRMRVQGATFKLSYSAAATSWRLSTTKGPTGGIGIQGGRGDAAVFQLPTSTRTATAGAYATASTDRRTMVSIAGGAVAAMATNPDRHGVVGVTVTLESPASAGDGTMVGIVKSDTAGGVVRVNDDTATWRGSLYAQNDFIIFRSNGVAWMIWHIRIRPIYTLISGQVATQANNFYLDPNAVSLDREMVPGGGGGGGGSVAAAGAIAAGGGGAAGGNPVFYENHRAELFQGPQAYSVPGPVSGAIALPSSTSTATSGNNGTLGGTLTAFGRQYRGGTQGSGATGGNAFSGGRSMVGVVQSGGTGGNGVAGSSPSDGSVGSGAGGGGISAANAAFGGGNGGGGTGWDIGKPAGGTGGVVGGAAPTAAGSGTDLISSLGGGGGAGGAAALAATAQDGGAGGWPGGGGGGGGAARIGFASGAGGMGAGGALGIRQRFA